jgi:predicted N-acetyltransferase YhbS
MKRCLERYATNSSKKRRKIGNTLWVIKSIFVCVPVVNISSQLLTSVDLDTVATHPDYQRRGAGSMLVKWGCELADVEGVAAYVDASKNGAPLYAKFGFVDFSNPGDEIASMART